MARLKLSGASSASTRYFVFCFDDPDFICRFAVSSHGRIGGQPGADKVALDWNCLRSLVPFEFAGVFTIRVRRLASLCRRAHSGRTDVGTHLHFAIWFDTTTGGNSRRKPRY